MQYPDVFPILSYARNGETRRAVFEAFNNRAHPENDAVLQSLLERRYALAQLLGRANYAEVAMADKMIGNPERARAFINQLTAYARPAAERDYRASCAASNATIAAPAPCSAGIAAMFKNRSGARNTISIASRCASISPTTMCATASWRR